jgi:hypothetical protein
MVVVASQPQKSLRGEPKAGHNYSKCNCNAAPMTKRYQCRAETGRIPAGYDDKKAQEHCEKYHGSWGDATPLDDEPKPPNAEATAAAALVNKCNEKQMAALCKIAAATSLDWGDSDKKHEEVLNCDTNDFYAKPNCKQQCVRVKSGSIERFQKKCEGAACAIAKWRKEKECPVYDKKSAAADDEKDDGGKAKGPKKDLKADLEATGLFKVSSNVPAPPKPAQQPSIATTTTKAPNTPEQAAKNAKKDAKKETTVAPQVEAVPLKVDMIHDIMFVAGNFAQSPKHVKAGPFLQGAEPSAKTILAALKKVLDAYPTMQVQFQGWFFSAAEKPGDKIHKELSESRAKYVAKQSGIAPGRVCAVGKGVTHDCPKTTLLVSTTACAKKDTPSGQPAAAGRA